METTKRRVDRVFFVPEGDHKFVSICPETGEIKECRDLVTLLQQVGWDLANGNTIKLQRLEG